MPSVCASSAARNSWSIDKRSTPGIEGTASRWRSPSRTKTGQIRSATSSRFSATMRRDQSARRLRRSRVIGKEPATTPGVIRAITTVSSLVAPL